MSGTTSSLQNEACNAPPSKDLRACVVLIRCGDAFSTNQKMANLHSKAAEYVLTYDDTENSTLFLYDNLFAGIQGRRKSVGRVGRPTGQLGMIASL